MRRILCIAAFLVVLLACIYGCNNSSDAKIKGTQQELCYGGSALLPEGWAKEDCRVTSLLAIRKGFNELTKTIFYYEENGHELAKIQMTCMQAHYSNIQRMKNEILNGGGHNYVDSFTNVSRDYYVIKSSDYEHAWQDDALLLTTIYEVSLIQDSQDQFENGFLKDFHLFYPFQGCIISGECDIKNRQRFEPVFNAVAASFNPQPILEYTAFAPKNNDDTLQLCSGAALLIPAGWEISSNIYYDTEFLFDTSKQPCPKANILAYFENGMSQALVVVKEFDEDEDYLKIYNEVLTNPEMAQQNLIKWLKEGEYIGKEAQTLDVGNKFTNGMHMIWAKISDIEQEPSTKYDTKVFIYCAEYFSEHNRFSIIASCAYDKRKEFETNFSNIINSFNISDASHN